MHNPEKKNNVCIFLFCIDYCCCMCFRGGVCQGLVSHSWFDMVLKQRFIGLRLIPELYEMKFMGLLRTPGIYREFLANPQDKNITYEIRGVILGGPPKKLGQR